MPAIVLGTGFAAVLMRQTRSSMLDVARRRLRPDRAREGPERAARRRRHALRNSLITVTTVLGLQLGALISRRGGHRDRSS